MLIVTRQFVGHGYNMLPVGTLLDPQPETTRALLQLGVVARYECKVDPLPAEVKKKEPTA